MSAQFEAAFTHLSDAILVIDPYQDLIVEANPMAQEQLGYSVHELCSFRASIIFLPSITEMISFTQEVLHKGHCWNNELHLQTRHNGSIRMEISANTMTVEPGRPLMIFTLRNYEELEKRQRITEANSLQRGGLERWRSIEFVFSKFERENHLILNAAGEGIYGVDTEGKTTFINPAAERILGWNAVDLIGKDIHSTIHHTHCDGRPYHGSECHIFASFKDGKVRHVDDEIFWCKDGSHIAVEYTSTPIVDTGRRLGAVVIFRDVSERRQSEIKLHAALNEVQALKQRLELENEYLQEEYRADHNYKEIVGNSTAIRRCIEQIDLVAPTDANVLIQGESGTGKELIARAIHASSKRHDRPLIRVNCASIPNELFESEFFGHVKGAFTGAVNDRAGRFELADGGTLFLDEVGEIPLELQSKLLRVLQEQQFERVGDASTRNVNVRIIAATNRELKQAVIEGDFREDLYFRLNVFPVESVPLRERIDDIPLLATHFLHQACKNIGKPEMRFSVNDIQLMQTYTWPGNIRELINSIERGVILSRGSRPSLDLTEQFDIENTVKNQTWNIQVDNSIIVEQDRRRIEKESILAALKMCKGKIFGEDGAAILLGVKPTTLSSRIKRYAINRYQFKEP